MQREKTILKTPVVKVKRPILSLKQQAMNLLNRVSDQKIRLIKAIELELELAETSQQLFFVTIFCQMIIAKLNGNR